MHERLYTVEAQHQVRGLQAGVLVNLLEVHYAGPNGVRGWVRVPMDVATRESVHAAILAQLDKQLGIQTLGEQQL